MAQFSGGLPVLQEAAEPIRLPPVGCPCRPAGAALVSGGAETGGGGGLQTACKARQDHQPSISRVFAKTSARCWSVPGSLAIKPTITASSTGRRGTSVQRPVQRLCGLAVSALTLALRTTGLLLVILGVAGSSPVSHPFFSFPDSPRAGSECFCRLWDKFSNLSSLLCSAPVALQRRAGRSLLRGDFRRGVQW